MRKFSDQNNDCTYYFCPGTRENNLFSMVLASPIFTLTLKWRSFDLKPEFKVKFWNLLGFIQKPDFLANVTRGHWLPSVVQFRFYGGFCYPYPINFLYFGNLSFVIHTTSGLCTNLTCKRRLSTSRKLNGGCCSFIWYQETFLHLSARKTPKIRPISELAHGLLRMMYVFNYSLWCTISQGGEYIWKLLIKKFAVSMKLLWTHPGCRMRILNRFKLDHILETHMRHFTSDQFKITTRLHCTMYWKFTANAIRYVNSCNHFMSCFHLLYLPFQCLGYFPPKHKDSNTFESHLDPVMLVFIR